jgi:predicted metalloprotease
MMRTGYRETGSGTRRLLVPLILAACLISMILVYNGEAFAQADDEEGFVTQVVSDVNAYWNGKFQLLGDPYTPAQVAFVYNKPVDTGCGFISTVDGPAYCPDNQTLYYPLRWRTDGRTLADYGPSAVEWGVAHEIGHNVQMQMDALGIQRLDAIPINLIELQADCLSGMYVSTQPGGIDAALTAMQDTGGVEHGTSEERMAAFELGYETGDLSQCLDLASGGQTAPSNG